MSDYWGRKKAVILTSCGALFNICLLLLALTFSASSSSSTTAITPGVPSSPSSYRAALLCLYVGTFIYGLTGSYGIYLTGIYAYAAGTSSLALLLSLPPFSPPFFFFFFLFWGLLLLDKRINLLMH